jgi:16S rRNA (guanine527-N7)-methyltransferase
MTDLWHHLAGSAGIQLTDEQRALLHRYLDLLLKANETMNLTRITERPAAEVGHVGDALTLLPFLPKGSHGIADVGSGGGVPGIPLAIVRPDAQVILIESTQKKAAFLGRTIEALRLRNVQLIIDRAENAARGNARESFDVVTARAVGALELLVEWCLPLVRIGGKMLAMKGAKVIDELTAADRIVSKLGGGPAAIHKVQLPGTEHHVIVEIPKIARTDMQFPRPPTIAKKKPIS